MSKCEICKSIIKIIYKDCCSTCLCLVYEGLIIDDNSISETSKVLALLELQVRLELWASSEYPHIHAVSDTFQV